jgi:hypothetical protein
LALFHGDVVAAGAFTQVGTLPVQNAAAADGRVAGSRLVARERDHLGNPSPVVAR